MAHGARTGPAEDRSPTPSGPTCRAVRFGSANRAYGAVGTFPSARPRLVGCRYVLGPARSGRSSGGVGRGHPEPLQWAAKYVVGAGDWLESDETAMRRVESAWTGSADTLRGLDSEATHVVKAAVSALDGETGAALTSHWEKLGWGAGQPTQPTSQENQSPDQSTPHEPSRPSDDRLPSTPSTPGGTLRLHRRLREPRRRRTPLRHRPPRPRRANAVHARPISAAPPPAWPPRAYLVAVLATDIVNRAVD
ncbi:hypothetical protein FB390_2038 [Nocardia bhagyanarayanae]|uniref:PPE family protein n=1 Tax=Nocardia bhagyanarayanae TaxID=1215925 RepID=A0A543F9B6_9NOCA|nr:hypothetical protein FB390_2038 [Nocardia bhagyanarayanae]